MGTTLTGTTPQDTYDSLIKVTDNGPLTGSLKKLTDGLGNDSSLSLSTTAASLSGTLAVTGAVTAGNNTNVQATSTNTRLLVTAAGVANTVLGFNNSGSTENGVVNNAGYIGILQEYPFVVTIGDAERMRITSAGNVGIGTATPLAKLQSTTAGTGVNEVALRLNNPNGNVAPTGVDIVLQSGYLTGVDGAALIRGGRNSAGTDSYITFQTNSGSGLAEVGRWLPTGGLTFNGDTAAANALDDYEEGTFTATLTPSTSGAIGGNPTFTTWTYTKIGRKVTINGVFVVNGVSSPVGTSIIVSGLPFTILNNNGAYGGFSCTYFAFSTSINTSEPARHTVNTTSLIISKDASTVALNDEIYVTATYFV